MNVSVAHHGVERLRGVDGLRAIAMTMVVAQHSGLLPFGWVGVWLFFAISGYVITRGLLAEEAMEHAACTPTQRYFAFMRRRVVRIAPAYFVYIAVCAALFVGVYSAAGFKDVPALATFVFNWRMIFNPTPSMDEWPALGHLWTLSVEQQFYVFFPLLFLGLPDRWRWKFALALVVAAPVVRLLWIDLIESMDASAGPEKLAFGVYASTICQFDAFLLGALLARFEPLLQARPRLCARICFASLVIGVFFFFAYVSLNVFRGDRGLDILKNIYSGILYGQMREALVYSVVGFFGVSVLAWTVGNRRGTAWLSGARMVFVGRISYSGYLWHALALWMFGQLIGTTMKSLPITLRIPSFLLILLVTVVMAWLSFRYIEQPAARRFGIRSKDRSLLLAKANR